MEINQAALDHLRTVLTNAAAGGNLDDDTLRDAIAYGAAHSYDGTDVQHLRSPSELESFRVDHGIQSSWHEPDEQDITATVIGHTLDTASTHVDNVYDHDEPWQSLTVVLHEQVVDEETNIVTGPGQPLAYVNLAHLLAWACQSVPTD